MTALAPVRIYAVQDRRRRGVARPWVVRWAVAGREHSRSYPTRAAADAARSALTSALGAGERFDPETGQPASRDAVATTVAVAAAAYVRAEWPSWTPHARRSAVEGLARAVIAAVDQRAPAPPEGARAFMVRTLLAPSPVPATGPVAAWVERWSLPLGALKGDAARRVWDALGVGEAGQSLAPSTAARYRKALRGCLADAVDAGRLASIPAPFSGERKRKASGGAHGSRIDPAVLPSPVEVAQVLAAVPSSQPRSWTARAVLATIYYAGARPSEAVALRTDGLVLPAQGWGSITIRGGYSHAAAQWVDDASERLSGPKGRPADHPGRTVPIPPVLVEILTDHLQRLPPQGELVFGKPMTPSNLWRAWRRALGRALPATVPAAVDGADIEVPNPLLRARVYDLRHAQASLQLAARVPPVEVARRLGHSVETLHRVYAHALPSGVAEANAQIEQALEG